MLPITSLFSNEDLDKLLFAGVDLYYKDEEDGEKFTPFNLIRLAKSEEFFLIFFNEQVIDDLLEEEKVSNFIDEVNVDILLEEGDEGLISSLYGFDKNSIIEFIRLIVQYI